MSTDPIDAQLTVHHAFCASAARTPAAPFLFVEDVTARAYGIEAGPILWRDALGKVDALRTAYAKAGYGHGHRVGLMLENRPAFLHHWFALNSLGVGVVPIGPDARSAELAWLIGHSEIVLTVCAVSRSTDVLSAAKAAGIDCRTIDEALEGGLPKAATPAPLASQPIGLSTECALLYTSGTTGRPKGCVLDNAYFLNAGRWYAAFDGVCSVRPDAERVITPLPLNHVNAMAFSTMVVVVAGGCLVQLDRFHPSTWLDSVRQSGATIAHYLGVMPAMLLAAPPADTDRAHAVRWGFGAGVDRKHHAAFEARFGFPLIEGWAMTETGAAGCIMATREPRQVGTASFGRPEPAVEMRLIDEAGRDVACGEPGELLVRAAGPDPRRHFFRGYLKDQAATDEAWAGGWLHTGDLVRQDAEGNCFFVDRKKNVIRRSGENISAVEVESVLNQHPAVKASAVAATPDDLRGDEVLACIVLREAPARAGKADAIKETVATAPTNSNVATVATVATDMTRLAESIVSHALSQLAYYKAPGWIAFVDTLPLTASQKIQRGQLRELARALPGEGKCIDTRRMKRRQP